MSEWYNREGRLIPVEEANALLGNWDYKVVDRTEVGSYVVSTVWLGLDHQFGDGPPLIFETMVFTLSSVSEENRKKPTFLDEVDPETGLKQFNPDKELMHDLACERYATEDEAVTGHRQMVELIQATAITAEDLLGESDEVHHGRLPGSADPGADQAESGDPSGEAG